MKFATIMSIFYPQDDMPYWNKIYGNNGFVALHFLIPGNKISKNFDWNI